VAGHDYTHRVAMLACSSSSSACLNHLQLRTPPWPGTTTRTG
jgi:hypothetical protein